MSLLDTDKYKFTVGQIVWRNFADVPTTYQLFDRTAKLDWHNTQFTQTVVNKIDELCEKRFELEDLEYLTTFLDPQFVDFLANYRLKRECVSVNNGITINGKWIDTILFEVYLLTILSEAYNTLNYDSIYYSNYILDIVHKAIEYKIKFAEFGTRRRYSKLAQEYAINNLKQVLTGTSNVLFAREFNISCVGTYGHELPCGLLGFSTEKAAVLRTLKLYLKEFGNPYSLTDTFTTDQWIYVMHFSDSLAAYFNVRHDSGDPYKYVDKMIKFYQDSNVNPLGRSILFTDSLTIDRCIEIKQYCKDKIRCEFGIGTSITNPFNPLNIVIKLVSSNGKDVYKLSDDKRKSIWKK